MALIKNRCMPDKYSLAKCEQYGRRLATRLCDQHFLSSSGSTLDGPSILSFTPVRQVNLFVVRQLLQQWQAEMNRLRSPYFDFEAPAVQEALQQFQNTLSRYIRVSRESFEPLLAQAVADALLLVTNPAAAFERLFFTDQSELTMAQLRDGLRYFDVNKEFFVSFLNNLTNNEIVSQNDIIGQLSSYQNATYRIHQPLEALIATLSALLPLTEADLWADGPTSSTAPVIPTPRPITPVAQALPISTPAPDSESPLIEMNVAASQPLVTSEPLQHSPSGERPLHEKLKATNPTSTPLASTLRDSQLQATPLVERGAPKIETLREAISINQRFSFINELFNGENMEYHAAIQHLDSLTNSEEARHYITQNLAQRYDWSKKEEHVLKLLKLIERKFAQ